MAFARRSSARSRRAGTCALRAATSTDARSPRRARFHRSEWRNGRFPRPRESAAGDQRLQVAAVLFECLDLQRLGARGDRLLLRSVGTVTQNDTGDVFVIAQLAEITVQLDLAHRVAVDRELF